MTHVLKNVIAMYVQLCTGMLLLETHTNVHIRMYILSIASKPSHANKMVAYIRVSKVTNYLVVQNVRNYSTYVCMSKLRM